MRIDTIVGSPRPKKVYNKEAEYLFKTVGKTFYVIKELDKIISFREWHQMGRPEFEKSGEHESCLKHLEKRNG